MSADSGYGNCLGPDSQYIKLISSDGHEFFMKREVVFASKTIKAMLAGPGQFLEQETNEIHFREISSHVLTNVCRYLAYKKMYDVSSTTIPEFDIKPEVAFDLYMAAHFLDC